MDFPNTLINRITIFCLFAFISSMAGRSETTTRYYLSEFDFLSNYSVSRSETAGKFHFRVDYDRLNRIVVKGWHDTDGMRVKSDYYYYQGTELSPEEKKIYDFQDQLIEYNYYGRDSLSTQFAEYAYHLNLAHDWDDRFTVIYYSDLLPDSCHFKTADSEIYGRIIYHYDQQNRMVSQVWEDLVQQKIVRKWVIIYDPVTSIARTIETDFNGHIAADYRLRSDGKEEAFIFLNPDQPRAVNNTQAAYRLYTSLDSCYLTWELIGGSEEKLPANKYHLYGVDLDKGDHIINLGFNAVIAENAYYRLSANGSTKQGNQIIPAVIDSLYFDTTSATVSLRIVPNSNRPSIAYSSNEPLAFAEIIYTTAEGRETIVPLTTAELAYTDDRLFVPAGQAELDSNINYSVLLKVQDLAGNWSNSADFSGLRFDSRPPTINVIKPEAGGQVNNPDIIFSSNEDLFSIDVVWESEDGTFDSITAPGWNAPYSDDITTSPDTLKFDTIGLRDSIIYSLKVRAIDLTGNKSDWTHINNIAVDKTAPLLTTIFPYDDVEIKDKSVSYVFNEPLGFAEYRWTPVSGPDTVAYHRVQLVGEELQPEKKIQIKLKNTPALVPGTRYNVSLSGRDIVGNEGNIITIDNIFFNPDIE